MAPPSDPFDVVLAGTAADIIEKHCIKSMLSEKAHPVYLLQIYRDTFAEAMIDAFSPSTHDVLQFFLRGKIVQLDQGFLSPTSPNGILRNTPIYTPRVAMRAQRIAGSPSAESSSPALSNHTVRPRRVANGIESITSKLSTLEDKVNNMKGRSTSVWD